MQTKIVIRDECNVKFEGLDLVTRKNLVKKFSFELPYARHLPAVRLGRWDGKVSFFTLGGSSFISLLPEVLAYLDQQGYEFDLVDQRQYRRDFDFATVKSDDYSHYVWPKGHPKEGEPIVLRDYQLEVINNFLANPQCLQEVATGAGKTIITAVLSHCCEPYGRTIVIVPNKSLVTQTEADYKNLGLNVGVYFGDRKEYNKTHTICTWQSLNNMLKNTKNDTAEVPIQDFLDNVVTIMVDECFSGDTLVLTPSGYVPIKDIHGGDLIINYSETTKEFKVDTVIKQHRNLTNSSCEKMYSLLFDNGATLEVTGNHKFLTNLGWCRADELTEEHEIIHKATL